MNSLYISIGLFFNILLLTIIFPFPKCLSVESRNNYPEEFPLTFLLSFLIMFLIIINPTALSSYGYQYIGSLFTGKLLEFMGFYMLIFNSIFLSISFYEYKKSDKAKYSYKLMLHLALFSIFTSIFLSSIDGFVLNKSFADSTNEVKSIRTMIIGHNREEKHSKNGYIHYNYLLFLDKNDYDLNRIYVSKEIYDQIKTNDLININIKNGFLDIYYITELELLT